jgi:large subunit ribosomal protein L1
VKDTSREKGRKKMKRGKAYRNTAAKIDKDAMYSPLAAVRIAKAGATSTKFDQTVDISMSLGVDPRKADQMVRSTVNLPHGTGKTARVLVFAGGEKAEEARVATPDLMGKVGKLGKVLGPRNLMPNPKTGTVTLDVAKAVDDIKGGKIEFRVDKHSNLHFIIGKASFTEQQLVENYAAALDEVLRVKPSSSKGRYIKKAVLSTTMGPGLQIDTNKTRNLLADDEDN